MQDVWENLQEMPISASFCMLEVSKHCEVCENGDREKCKLLHRSLVDTKDRTFDRWSIAL